MANELKTTFSDMEAAAFKAYAEDLLEAYPRAPERQRLQAYLLQTIASDRASLVEDQAAINEKRLRRRDHQEILEELVLEHAHDYSRASSLFQEQTKTDAEIIALCTQDDAEIYLRGRNITGDITLSGNNVKLCGLDVSGSALTNDLAHTCIVTGRLIVSGSAVTIEGIHFKFAAEWTQGANEFPMIAFAGGTNTKLTIKNCTFENTGSHADGRFWNGAGSGGGVQTVQGCTIKNFTSWMLLDATTSSGTPSVKLDSFTMDSCRIDNCMGSVAVRGIQANPNGVATFTNNVIAFGALGQHSLFWDCFEANNTLRVICTGNEVTGAVATDNRGFLQAWSKSAIPWMVRYRENTITNFAACFRCACNATVYAPNTYDVQSSLKSVAAETTNVTNGASYVYPYNDAQQTYAPENGATFPEPAGDFEGLTNFAHA